MFSKTCPASDIHELLGYLRSAHEDGVIYRGQTQDFPALVPSAFRLLVDRSTVEDSVIGIDADKFLAGESDLSQASRRYQFFSTHFPILGSALCNLVCQQYGIRSECLDFTESLTIAAFFATRTWPHYSHMESSDELGVIFRLAGNGVTLTRPQTLRVHQLDDWHERGLSEGIFFDFFKRKNELDRVFDRDNWWLLRKGRYATVATLPSVLSWRDILAVVENERADPMNAEKESYDEKWFFRTLVKADWRLSRIAAQRGGLVRPSTYWSSQVPADLKVAADPREMSRIRGGFDINSIDLGEPFWPLAIPSLAVKEKLTGIGNIRHWNGFTAHYFRHGPRRVTGLLRRDLWPEPSEDPIYGAVWVKAMPFVWNAGDPSPAIDDPDQGVLDRGYVVAGEKRTRDARDLDDLLRGLLDDVNESINFGTPTAEMFARGALAMLDLSGVKPAISFCIRGLRLSKDCAECWAILYWLLTSAGKIAWGDRALQAADQLNPLHPVVLHAKAVKAFNEDDLHKADALMQQASEQCAMVPHRLARRFLLNERATIAGALGNQEMQKELERQASLGM